MSAIVIHLCRINHTLKRIANEADSVSAHNGPSASEAEDLAKRTADAIRRTPGAALLKPDSRQKLLALIDETEALEQDMQHLREHLSHEIAAQNTRTLSILQYSQQTHE